MNDRTLRISRSHARKQEIIVHHGGVRETARSNNDHGSRPRGTLVNRMTGKDQNVLIIDPTVEDYLVHDLLHLIYLGVVI
jgi:hypothetical protein